MLLVEESPCQHSIECVHIFQQFDPSLSGTIHRTREESILLLISFRMLASTSYKHDGCACPRRYRIFQFP